MMYWALENGAMGSGELGELGDDGERYKDP